MHLYIILNNIKTKLPQELIELRKIYGIFKDRKAQNY